MNQPAAQRLSPAEYLEIERAAVDVKSEFFDGEMFAMSGAKRAHILISGNLSRALGERFDDRDCEAYANDMRTWSPSGLYCYPDVVAVCGEPKFQDDTLDTLENPKAIFEVLSESTEGYDRGKKFELYRPIQSLTDYVLVAQDRCHVERFARDGDRWILTEFSSLDSILHLESIDVEIRLHEIYRKVLNTESKQEKTA